MSKIQKILNGIKADKVTTALAVLLFVYGILFFFISGRYFPASGDEGAYYRASGALADIYRYFVALEWGKIPGTWYYIVNHGWFIPSTSFIVSPVRLFTTRLDLVRLTLFLFNYGLTLYVLVMAYQRLGKKFTRILALSFLLMPMFTVYSFTLWGGAIAGRLLLILLLFLIEIEQKKKGVSTKQALQIGLLLGLTIYFRHSVILISLVIGLFIWLIYLQKETIFSSLKKTIGKVAIIGITTLIVLAPWSLSVSKKFDIPTLTVTSSHTSYIYCCSPPKLRNAIKTMHSPTRMHYRYIYDYYVEQAKGDVKKIYKIMKYDNGISRRSISFERAKMLAEKTFEKIFHLSRRGGFLARFLKIPDEKKTSLSETHRSWSTYMYVKSWYFLCGMTLVVLLFPFSAVVPYSISIVSKLMVVGIILPHLITFAAHSRHGIILIPLMSFLFAYLMSGKLFSKDYFKYRIKKLDTWLVYAVQIAVIFFTIYVLTL